MSQRSRGLTSPTLHLVPPNTSAPFLEAQHLPEAPPPNPLRIPQREMLKGHSFSYGLWNPSLPAFKSLLGPCGLV